MTETRPILDWRPRHDPASLAFPIRTALPTATPRKDRQWNVGPITDQGAEGACVGHALTAEAMASPIPVDLTRLRQHAPTTPNEFARFLYNMAKFLDPWNGEDYDGTSVLAGAKAAQNLGLIKEYRWALGGANDVADAISFKGPVVLGINWYESMYEPKDGIVTRGGNLAGGHAILASGITRNSARIPGKTTVTLTNSWGEDWGINGQAEMALDDLAGLLRENGEACVPTRRSYGR